MIEERGHTDVAKQPVAEMDDAEWGYKIDLNGNDTELPF